MLRVAWILGTLYVASLIAVAADTVGTAQPETVDFAENCDAWLGSLGSLELPAHLAIACQVSDGPDPIPLVRRLPLGSSTKARHPGSEDGLCHSRPTYIDTIGCWLRSLFSDAGPKTFSRGHE
jgi:hypothetical protein